jgi:hypothetical protein
MATDCAPLSADYPEMENGSHRSPPLSARSLGSCLNCFGWIKETMPNPISRRQAAKMLGVSEASVRRAVRENRITPLPDGRLDADKCVGNGAAVPSQLGVGCVTATGMRVRQRR